MFKKFFAVLVGVVFVMGIAGDALAQNRGNRNNTVRSNNNVTVNNYNGGRGYYGRGGYGYGGGCYNCGYNNFWAGAAVGLGTAVVAGALIQSQQPQVVVVNPPAPMPPTVYSSYARPVIVPVPGYAPPSGPTFIQPGPPAAAQQPLFLAGPAYIDQNTGRVCQDYNTEGRYPNGFHYRMTTSMCDNGMGQMVEVSPGYTPRRG